MSEQVPDRDEDEIVGDAVCWLARVCVECGALVEGDGACWNCGARLPEE